MWTTLNHEPWAEWYLSAVLSGRALVLWPRTGDRKPYSFLIKKYRISFIVLAREQSFLKKIK